MLFVIHCLDHPGKVADRLAHYDAHKSYLSTAPMTSVVSGPLLADDHEAMIGSMFIVEAESFEAVKEFNANDPFNAAGIWQDIRIHPFSMRVDNRGAR
ncbi:YciI family protein [Celeribacter sp.]|uniref:YciI family protein n=1 Tax=Celeribacter sp. TaxID=1890673 RepID=UPI003A9184F0